MNKKYEELASMLSKNEWIKVVYDILRAHEVMDGWVDSYILEVASEAYERELMLCGGDESDLEDPHVAGNEELEAWIDGA